MPSRALQEASGRLPEAEGAHDELLILTSKGRPKDLKTSDFVRGVLQILLNFHSFAFETPLELDLGAFWEAFWSPRSLKPV